MMVVDVPDEFEGPNFTAVRASARQGMPMPFAFDSMGNEFADLKTDMAAAESEFRAIDHAAIPKLGEIKEF